MIKLEDCILDRYILEEEDLPPEAKATLATYQEIFDFCYSYLVQYAKLQNEFQAISEMGDSFGAAASQKCEEALFSVLIQFIPFFEASSANAADALIAMQAESGKIRHGKSMAIKDRERDSSATKDAKEDLVERYQHVQELCKEIMHDNDRDWPGDFAGPMREIHARADYQINKI